MKKRLSPGGKKQRRTKEHCGAYHDLAVILTDFFLVKGEIILRGSLTLAMFPVLCAGGTVILPWNFHRS